MRRSRKRTPRQLTRRSGLEPRKTHSGLDSNLLLAVSALASGISALTEMWPSG